ncbi:MAG: CAP domain-containing protein [Acidimicrobiia bacterium]
MPRLLRRPTLILAFLGLLTMGAVACAVPPADVGAGANPSELSLLVQTNQQRANSGIGPLTWCPSLGRSATAHAGDQAARNTMTHTGSDGSDIAVRAVRNGYNNWTALAENVAAGYNSESEVLYGWMTSPGHRANILNPAFTHVGSGFAITGGTRYWTQDFGRSGSC